jgi:predicted transcriptional regulator
LRLQSRSENRCTPEPDIERKQKSRMVSFRVAEDDFFRLDALARQTSCSRAEVLRRCLRGARLKSTVDAQALHEEAVREVSRAVERLAGLR